MSTRLRSPVEYMVNFVFTASLRGLRYDQAHVMLFTPAELRNYFIIKMVA